MATLIPLVILIFGIGFFPNPLLTRMHASVKTLLAGESERVSIIAPLEPDHVARDADSS
jgi:NADH-quinone oxidoreductase subunit M